MPAVSCGQWCRAASCRHGTQGPSTAVSRAARGLPPFRPSKQPCKTCQREVRGCTSKKARRRIRQTKARERAQIPAPEHHEGWICAGGPTMRGRGFVPARFHDSERDEARGPGLCAAFTQVRPGICDRRCLAAVSAMRGTLTQFPCPLCRALSPHPRVTLCSRSVLCYVSQARLGAATWPLSRGRGIT